MSKSDYGRDFKEEPVEWRELKDFVVDQVKRAGRKIDVDYVKDIIRERGGNIDGVLDKLEKKGYLSTSGQRHPPQGPRPRPHPSPRVRYINRNPEKVSEDRNSKNIQAFDFFRDYRRKLLKRVDRGLTGFRVHFAAFFGVNAFLVAIWALTGAGFPWFFFPLMSWGIGIMNHLNAVVQRLRQRREVQKLPDLTAKETRFLKKMHRKRTGFAAHFISSASLAGFLFMTNTITGAAFPWFLIPTAALFLGVFLHWSAYIPRVRRMKKEIAGWISGVKGDESSVDTFEGSMDDPAILHEASALRRTIGKQIDDVAKEYPSIGDDMRPLLETYFQQVRQLAVKSADINRILSDLPRTGLQQDRVKLQNRMQKVESDRLRKEYEKSIMEVDQQMASIKQLEHSGEMLELRLSSAVNLMKQLQLDLARMKGASLTSASSLDLLKDRSDELSKYLEDLETGYNELDSEL